MQHPDYSNAIVGGAKIDYMPPYPAPTVTFPDVVTTRSQLWLLCERGKSGCEIVGIATGLFEAPFFQRVEPNSFKVVFGFGC